MINKNIILVDISGKTNFFTHLLAQKVGCKLISIEEHSRDRTFRRAVINLRKYFLYVWNILVLIYLVLIRCGIARSRLTIIYNIPANIFIETFMLGFLGLFRLRKCLILHNSEIFHDKIVHAQTQRKFLSKFDMFIVHAEEVQTMLLEHGIPSDHILLIDLPCLYNKREHSLQKSRKGRLRILFIGNDRQYKGLGTLLEALAALPDDYKKNVVLKCLGRVRRTGLSLLDMEKIQYEVEDRWLTDVEMLDYIAECDVAILPYVETSGSAALTTCYGAGIPYLATNLKHFSDFKNKYGGGSIFKLSPKQIELASILTNIIDGVHAFPKKRNQDQLTLDYYAKNISSFCND